MAGPIAGVEAGAHDLAAAAAVMPARACSPWSRSSLRWPGRSSLPATTVGDDGTLATVAWWAGVAALLVFTVYLAVNAAALLGLRGRKRTVGLIAAHLVLPVAGLVLGAVLLLALLAALLGARDSRMGPTVVLFCLVVLAADALAVLWMSGWRPRVARPRIAWPRVALPHRGARDKAPAPAAPAEAAPADQGEAGSPAATDGETGKKPGRRARRRARGAGADAESGRTPAAPMGAPSRQTSEGARPAARRFRRSNHTAAATLRRWTPSGVTPRSSSARTWWAHSRWG